MKIHPTAQIDPRAELGLDIEIGPFTVISGHVALGDGCVVGSHAHLQGPLTLGAGNRIFSHATLGLDPQDLKYDGEPSRLEIGDRNQFREFVTAHRGTAAGEGRTIIGSDNLLMAYCHVAHDVRIADRCILSNAVQLGGHVQIDSETTIGGLSGIHQFVRLGRGSFIGGCSAITLDVVPFGLAAGNRAALRHYNAVGLRRAGASAEMLARIRSLFSLLVNGSISTDAVLEAFEREQDGPEAREIADFIRSSTRGILRGTRQSRLGN